MTMTEKSHSKNILLAINIEKDTRSSWTTQIDMSQIYIENRN